MQEVFKTHHTVFEKIISLISEDKKGAYGLDSVFDGISEMERIWVLGVGKASVSVAKIIQERLGARIKDGIVITNESVKKLGNIQVFQGSHPLPDEQSVSSAYELLKLARQIPEGDTVFFCLSGGASAMLCLPPDNIEIDELQIVFGLLLNSGATIAEMNCVRKHLSEIKGGRLAQELAHTKLITLIVSDVPDDDIEVIGSAPTIPDSSTFKNAFQVLEKYGLWEKIPYSVRIHLTKGMNGDIPDSPKPGEFQHPNHQVKIISSASLFAGKARDLLKNEGYNTWITDKAYNQDVREVSKLMCEQVISVLSQSQPVQKPAALVYFGESTVQVKGNGKGGRNQELALAIAISLEGQHKVSLLSMGTDGIDGPTDAAGAIITSQTTLNARKQKIEPETFLSNNDAYHFHEKMGTLIKTGPTGNNLMDLQVLIIE